MIKAGCNLLYFFYRKQLTNVNACIEKNDPLKQKYSASEH